MDIKRGGGRGGYTDRVIRGSRKDEESLKSENINPDHDDCESIHDLYTYAQLKITTSTTLVKGHPYQ